MANDTLLSLEDARKILGVSERSMYRYIHSGRLMAYKIGYWKIKRSDLNAFIQQNPSVPSKRKKRRS